MPCYFLLTIPYFRAQTLFYRRQSKMSTPSKARGIQAIKKDPNAPYRCPLLLYVASIMKDEEDSNKSFIAACDENDFIKLINVGSTGIMESGSWYLIKNFTVHVGRMKQIYIMTNERTTTRKTFKASGPPSNDMITKATQLVSPESPERTIEEQQQKSNYPL